MVNIASIRIHKGFSQNELARLVGLTGSAISQYESGKRKPNIDTLKKIAQALNCTVDDLIKEGV